VPTRSLRYFATSYLKLLKHFRNGAALSWAHHRRDARDVAVFWDGHKITNANSRVGFVDTLVEIWGAEEYTRDFYAPNDGDVILDVGANVGLFSIWVSRHARQARVYAFEPFPENFDAFRQNLQGWAHEIVPHKLALGSENGLGTMLDGGDRSLDHQLTTRTDAPNGLTVETIDFAHALELTQSDEIDFLKMDIEGAELDVLGATSPEQLRRIKRISLEYHDNIRPGTSKAVSTILRTTHTICSVSGAGYGLIRAIRK